MPRRGLDFANAFYGRIGHGELAAHVAVLRQIPHMRPWMDMRSVGVFGRFRGGYFAVRALLQAPARHAAERLDAHRPLPSGG